MAKNKYTGDTGENLAVEFLQEKGFDIITRNYRYGHGELDVIAKDNNTIVFVEVKTRRSDYFGNPAEAITKSKQKQIRKIASLYLYENNIDNIDCRFDVITIVSPDLDPKIEHYCNCF